MNINLGLHASATGTDTITATYSPVPTLVNRKILFLRTAGSNTTTSPTFNPNGLGAKPIYKRGGSALLVGDMPYEAILVYDSVTLFWTLLNPQGSELSQDIIDALNAPANAPTAANPFATVADLGVSKPNDILIREALGSVILASTIPIDRVAVSLGLTSQRQYFMPVYLREGATITGVKWFQDVQGVYTSSNYNGVGLYSYSAGTLTLVASSTDDGLIWKATAGTMSSKAFSSTYVATAGLYYISALWSSSATTTAPVLGAGAVLRGTEESTADFTNSGKISHILAGRTSLIASQASSGTTTQTVMPFLAIY